MLPKQSGKGDGRLSSPLCACSVFAGFILRDGVKIHLNVSIQNEIGTQAGGVFGPDRRKRLSAISFSTAA